MGLANRRRSGNRGAPPLRTPRALPRVLGTGEVEAVLGAVQAQAGHRSIAHEQIFDGLLSRLDGEAS
ncbi:hypothetical protein ACFYUV_09835 [Nonomuraea sp. NPDC003560]|uniref:hypothetical protein n=1 Tax=Nonomuraea sp. NPDC003560 TaxID=3364341 RepID=UPI0036C2919A